MTMGRKKDGIRQKSIELVLFTVLVMLSLFLINYPKSTAYVDITVTDGKVTNVSFSQKTAKISWQRDEEDSASYLFLPSFANLSRVFVRINGETEASLDGIQLEKDNAVFMRNFQPGSHEIEVDGEKCGFILMQSAHLDTIFIRLNRPLSWLQENQENYSDGTMEIYAADGTRSYRGNLEKMNGHGNSTWYERKKSYALRLSEKAALFGKEQNKKYLLISNVKDGSFLRNKLFYDMADTVGIENTVESGWTDLYVDGIYQGMYLLTEKIDVSSGMLDIGNLELESRELNDLPVESYSNFTVLSGEETVLQGWNLEKDPADISGGYLLEMDYPMRYAGEPSKFRTEHGQYVVIKSPAYASAGQATYIRDYVQAFEDALYAEDGRNTAGKSWTDYVDMDSFVKRYVLDEISMNIDAGYSSTFFYKPRHEDKLYAGPVWDYDIALGNAGGWGEEAGVGQPEGFYVNKSGWFEQFYHKPEFYEEVKKVYRKEYKDYLEMLCDTGIEKYQDYTDASAAMDNARWSKDNRKEEVLFLKDFLEKRKAFLEQDWLEENK